LLEEIEKKNATELLDIESTLNSLQTRCGPDEVKAIAKEFASLRKKLQNSHEKAKKVKEVFNFTTSEGYVAL